MIFNGDYYDSNGDVRNILGEAEIGTGRPNDAMHPTSGDFFAGDGSVHNIDELAPASSSGIWTPTVIQGDIYIASVSVAKYSRIGNIVYAWARFTTAPNSTPNSSIISIRIGGLPYPVNYGHAMFPPSVVHSNATTITGWGVLSALLHNSQQYFSLSFVSGNAINPLTASNHRQSEVIHDIMLIYPTDSEI